MELLGESEDMDGEVEGGSLHHPSLSVVYPPQGCMCLGSGTC